MPHLVEQVAADSDRGLSIAGRQQQGELTVAGPTADRSRHSRGAAGRPEKLDDPLHALHAAGDRQVFEPIESDQQQAQRTTGLPARRGGRRQLAEKRGIKLSGRRDRWGTRRTRFAAASHRLMGRCWRMRRVTLGP